MARAADDVTDTELAILRAPGAGEATRPGRLALPRGGEAHYATVQNLLGRLERRGSSDMRDGNVLVFAATNDRDELIRRRLQCLADTFARVR
jgi:hypothetical protein